MTWADSLRSFAGRWARRSDEASGDSMALTAVYDEFGKDNGSGVLGTPHAEEWIVADELEIGREYQRNVNLAWVKQIADGFDPFLLDPLLVNRRADGRLVVMDGQHRLLAVRQVGYGDQRVPCLVYESLPLELEATRFNTQDTRRALNPQQRFAAALVARESEALVIYGTVQQLGFQVNLTGGDLDGGRIPGVSALRTIYRKYSPKDLADVLRIVRDGFGTDEGPRAAVLVGLARFNAKYRGEYDRRHLIDVLRRMTLNKLGAEGADMANALGIQTADGVGRAIHKAYNYRRLEANKLESWETRDARSQRKKTS
jgi:hypothetical protein